MSNAVVRTEFAVERWRSGEMERWERWRSRVLHVRWREAELLQCLQLSYHRGHVAMHGMRADLVVSRLLLQLEAIWMSVACVTTKGHSDVHGLCSCLKLC